MQGLRFKQYLFVFSLLVSLNIAFVLPQVLAASTSGSVLTTSPISVDLSAVPGTTTATTLEVQNNGLKTITINVKLDEFNAIGTNGQARIFTPPSNDPSLSWVHFSQTSFSAEPNVWIPVTMTIQVPKTAADGYYYAVLFAPSTASVSINTVTDKVNGANAILVLLNATNANQNNQLKVQSFSSDKFSYQYLPANFSINIHNSGNTFTVPKGDIFISRTKNGSAIDTIDINSGQGNILPGTNRIFQVQWNDGYPVYQLKRINGQIVSGKNGQPEQELSWNISRISKFRYGRYYARLVLVYNQDGRDIPVNAIVSFWVIPWTLIAAFIGLILLFVFLFFLGRWSVKRSIKKSANEVKTK